jgi:hypothetical protein
MRRRPMPKRDMPDPNADPTRTPDLAALLTERRLDREDYQIQIEAAARSIELGYYGCAKAELRGAILILDMMEERDGPKL